MADITSVKYVLFVDDGEEPTTVVDTLEEAKKAIEGVKSSASKARIEKASVKNFGKANEETVSSEVAEKWEKQVDDDSSAEGDEGNVSPDNKKNTEDPANVSNDNQKPVEPVAIIEEEPVELDWKEYYVQNGAIIGYHYFLPKDDDEIKAEEKEIKKEEKELDKEEELEEEPAMKTGGEVEVKGVECDEFIELCKKPDAKGIAELDVKVTTEFLGDLKKHKVKDIKVSQETREVFFVTDDNTDYKGLMKTVNAIGSDDFEETKDNGFRLHWN